MVNLLANSETVSYGTQPRGWMDNIAFEQWLRETRAICKDPNNGTPHLFSSNCSRHNTTDRFRNALDAISTQVTFLSHNATNLRQPFDSFIMQKLISVCRRKWKVKKTELILESNWLDGPHASKKIRFRETVLHEFSF